MTEIEKLEQGIAALETQRAILGDAVVDAMLAPIREKLAALKVQAAAQAAPSIAEQQRKHVTVLFADVSGFTAMSETMDAEDVTEIINALWQRLDAVITAHGGKIDKHIGDAVMALWGVDAAREDDPERAIRAALDMQAALAAFRDERQLLLAMRIGLNSGPALLGEVGSTHEFTAMGDTVNLASRLENAAPVGGILISHDTYRHVRGVFDVQALEPVSVKGKAEPVQVYVVQGEQAACFSDEQARVEGVQTRMIGRDAELKRLQEAFYALWNTAQGQFQLITVIGGAGMGKSRLLDEFTIWIEDRPEEVWFFKGRASQERQGMPYALLRDVFAFRFQIQDSDPLPAVKEKMQAGVSVALGEGEGAHMRAHFIGQLLGFDFSDSPYIKGILDNAQQIRDRALAYAGDYFKAVAVHRPNVILLEDIHWADDSSLDAINHLTKILIGHPLLIICAARPELLERRPHWGDPSTGSGQVPSTGSGQVPSTALRTGGRAFHTRLDLHPLSKRHSRQLVDDVLQKADNVPDALRELVVSNAEGNPFYVEELIKMLIEDGVVLKDAERWCVEPTRLVGVRIPPTLTAVLQARLDRLPPREKTTLQQAAVVGRIFWDAAVAFLDNPQAVSLSETAAALSTLREREMVFQRGTSDFVGTREYIFKHTLLRDVIYESVLKRLRRTYHASAAEWLITNSGDRASEIAGLIAEHLEQAGQMDQAAGYLRRAGEKAMATGAFREALDYFQRALALLPGARGQRVVLLTQAGEALLRLSQYETAQQFLEEGLVLAQHLGDDGGRAGALGYLGWIADDQGDWGKARACLQESLALARKIDDQARMAYALWQLGWIDISQGAYPEAKTRFAESRALFQALGDRQGQARNINGLGVVAQMLGEYQESRTLRLESLALFRELGDRYGESVTLNNLGETLRVQGEYVEAQRYYQESLPLMEEIGHQLGIATTLGNLGHVASAQGEYASAEGYYHEAIRLAMDIGATPDALESLAGLTGVFARISQQGRALELLGLIIKHPALKDETRQQFVEPSLARLRTTLPAEVIEAALARSTEPKLENVVQAVLAENVAG